MENLTKLFKTAGENLGFLAICILIVAALLAVSCVSQKLMDKKKMEDGKKNKEQFRVHRMVLIAMLSAIAVILMLFDFPLWFLPGFYKIDASELPVLIGAFVMGPFAGVVIEFIKVVLNLFINGTATAFVGEFANFLIGCSLVVPASMIYYAKKTKKTAIIGLVVGTVTCILAGCLLNAFVLLPAYSKAFHMEMEKLIAMGTAKNAGITGMLSFVAFAVAPFNLIKCAFVSVITMLIYKKISHLLKKEI